MNGMSNQLFASASLPKHQNSGIGRCNSFDLLEYRLQRRAISYDPIRGPSRACPQE
jgi:hypothetical protein